VRAVLQRVSRAQVSVGGEVIGRCGRGLLVLVCAMLRDVGGGALVISQFTLAADLRGNRPGFSTAAPPERGRALYEHFAARLAAEGLPVETGSFGADMAVELVNDGPVTIWIDTEQM
jgi:D-tyrosyl-tRNA(Tyr) deacylase